MGTTQSLNWAKYKERLREIILFLPNFFKSPINGMKTLPNWDWLTIISLQVLFAATVGLLSGLIMGTWISIVFQPFTSSLSALFIGFSGAGLFYYFVLFYLNRKVDFLRLYTMVALATLPMIALRILSIVGPPVTLIGFAITCLLCSVGLVENFAIERKVAIRLLGSIYALFAIVWATGVIVSSRDKVEMKHEVTPETLDILQKELQKNQK
jgi:hypothetical protein